MLNSMKRNNPILSFGQKYQWGKLIIIVGIFLVSFLFSRSISVKEINAQTSPSDLSGTGQQATQKFSLDSGLSIFHMTHSGQHNFAVWLLDSSGNRVELLANEIGGFNGVKAVGVTTSGEYLLDIAADGDWTVKVEQPRPTTAPSVPQNFTGKGQQTSEFFSTGKGLATFKMTHQGSHNFSIWLLNDKGQRVELLVNEIGAFDGSKALGISKEGIYILDITADGDWTVSVEGNSFQPSSKEIKEGTSDVQGEPKKGCFIATAAYGTPTAPEIEVLRKFRDKTLLQNDFGRKFVEFYYQTSPPAADFISEHPLVKETTRILLVEPVVKVIKLTEGN